MITEFCLLLNLVDNCIITYLCMLCFYATTYCLKVIINDKLCLFTRVMKNRKNI